MIRMMMLSNQPPAYPATAPRVLPTMNAIVTVKNPSVRLTLAP